MLKWINSRLSQSDKLIYQKFIYYSDFCEVPTWTKFKISTGNEKTVPINTAIQLSCHDGYEKVYGPSEVVCKGGVLEEPPVRCVGK